MNNHHSLLRYMMGWHKGAGHNAFTNEEMDDSDFKSGFEQGRKASKEAYVRGCMRYHTTLNEIRPADGSPL